MSTNEKYLYTSCRQMGLRRKSAGFTPPTSTSQPLDSSINIAAGTQNNSFHNTEECSKSNSLINSSSSSFAPSQPTSKRRKYSAPRFISATSKTKGNLHSPEIGTDGQFSEDELSTSSSKDEQHPDHERDFAEIQPLIDQIKYRIVLKQTEISNLESQFVNTKQHNLQALHDLISKWRIGCQQALNELLAENKKRAENCTMDNLMDSVGIPAELVHYSETEMDFYD